MHYPTSEEVLNSLGLSRVPPESAQMSWITPLAIFAAGVLAGVAGAVLLTPKSGREVRHDLKDAASRAGHNVKDAVSWAGEQAMSALPNSQAALDVLEEDAHEGGNHTPAPKARDRASAVKTP